jgi:hypothetical protein
MFHRRTLFVLGAGTSAEAGMPIGPKLAAAIGKKMDIRFEHFNKPVGEGDIQLYAQITNQLRTDANEIQSAGWLIRDGIALSQSIDDFLDIHRDDQHVNLFGKAAIVKTILEAERTSKLSTSLAMMPAGEVFKPEKLANTWFLKFMHMLGRGIPKGDARQIFDNVSFIIFNYDRCVEHFLHNALQKVYGFREGEAADILADCTIIHPYGQVGEYSPKGGGISFGAASADYRAVSQQIKTYTEQIAAADVMTQIAAEFHKAECIVFLGFAYHSQNMRLLAPATPLPPKHIFGTAYDMSDADTDVVSHQIANFFQDGMSILWRERTHFENKLTAAGLFDNYAKSLSGGD